VLLIFTLSIKIVYNIILCYLILHFIITLKNNSFYFSIYSSSLFVFNFSIIIIIINILLIDFATIYTIAFSIALLILLRVFIKLSLFFYNNSLVSYTCF